MIKKCKKLSFDELFNPKKQSGVWMLLGRNNPDELWICLQVAKSIDIYGEMDIDISWMKPLGNIGSKDYINQFGEKVDEEKILDYPNERQQLYSMIAEKYKEFAFVVVAENIDNQQRKIIEKYVAFRTKAKYWRNGGTYKTPKDINMQDVEVDISGVDKKCIAQIDEFIDEYIVNYKIKKIEG